MIIHSITLYNFGIYSGEQKIHPSSSESLFGKPITLVGGFNGRGKTSLLEAILLVLYGNRSPIVRERRISYSDYLESLMHQGLDEEATQSWIELDLELLSGDQMTSLRIVRSWKRANVRTVDKLKVWVNGAVDSHVSENWESYVEELIPSAIAELFFFDGERISELAESDQTIDSLQTAIQSLLGLEIVDRTIKDLTLVIRKNQKKFKNDESAVLLENLQSELEEVQLEADRLKQKIAGLNNRIIQANRKQTELETEYFKSGGNLLESRDKLLAKRDEVRGRLSDVKAELLALFAGPLPLVLVQQQLQQVQRLVHEDQKLTQAKMALPILKEQNESLLKQLEGMQLAADVLRRIEQTMEERRNSIDELASLQPTLPMSYLGIGQLQDFLGSLGVHLKQNALDVLNQYESVEFELEQLERHLLVEVDQENTTQLLEKLAHTRMELVEFEQERSRLEKEYATSKRKIQLLENKMTRTAAERGGVQEAERIVQYAGKAQETFKAFREELTKRKIHLLADSVTEAFDVLTHKTTLVSNIQVDPQTFRFSLWTANGKEISKAKLSSGERQMLAVAILWGLGRVSGRKLPVIIDTPMGRLDSLHRMNFVKKYLPHASHQVIVLSTDTEIVGEYLESLRNHIGQEYLLKYDDQQRRTEILEGYFDTVGVAK
ncbi:DNA sulfur modification protein DndD [Brevibacillus dissolubilis]|uniref:DNA sulfur modification protein DndD n=1 Tax=Brevibacillus dissolubilis TaxID=1844116 RepID=UPI0011178F2B|nr:DNA sulfur modification protein DndD [Brevibacillus dissolubilis]